MANTLPMVSIGIAVWNGELFLAQTLQSLLQQDYQNIEIIVLDNQSTDSTSQICKELAAQDLRIRYILDEQMRDVMSAQIKAAHLALGDFYMVACDDDWYEPSYISELMSIISQDPTIGLAYADMGFIDEEGEKSASYPIKCLNRSDRPIDNFRAYLSCRDPVPIIFGVIRKDLHLDALKFFKRADNRGWDHDNLYMMRLLTQTHVEGISNTLLFYRQRDRELLYKKRNQYYQPNSPFAIYLNHIFHQWAVTGEIKKIIAESSFTEREKRSLYLSNYMAFIHHIRLKYLKEPIKNSSTWKKMRSLLSIR